MSFTNAPVTRAAVLGLVATSIGVSVLDVKHYFYILIDTHLWKHRQLWRLLAYQCCYTNSTEVLFAGMCLYNLKNVERMWGSRKYASFLVIASLLTSVIPPLILVVLRPLWPSAFNYIPAGPTPIVFAVLAQYQVMVPRKYMYRVAMSPVSPTAESFKGVTFTDKSYQYLIALHLALLQWPGSLIGAGVGWIVGQAWREGFLPSGLDHWRIPGWMVGMRSQARSSDFEGLRRRLEDENTAAGSSTGVQSQTEAAVEGGEGAADRRRQQVTEQV